METLHRLYKEMLREEINIFSKEKNQVVIQTKKYENHNGMV